MAWSLFVGKNTGKNYHMSDCNCSWNWSSVFMWDYVKFPDFFWKVIFVMGARGIAIVAEM
jgi:hypothetical protein